MTRAQILRKKTGIVLAIIGIVLSLLPAVRMADGTKLFIFQIIGNETFFKTNIATEADFGALITGILISIVLIFGLLIHILNLFLWTRKTEKTYIGVMGLSWASFLGLLGSSAFFAFVDSGATLAMIPYTIWQFLRLIITLSEAIIKLNGEELFSVFFPEK